MRHSLVCIAEREKKLKPVGSNKKLTVFIKAITSHDYCFDHKKHNKHKKVHHIRMALR